MQSDCKRRQGRLGYAGQTDYKRTGGCNSDTYIEILQRRGCRTGKQDYYIAWSGVLCGYGEMVEQCPVIYWNKNA